MSIKIYIYGSYACFTRPELKSERMSYDCLTPSAARNIIQAIYWKPSIEYHIIAITVLKPINFITLKRNEVKSKAVKNGKLFIEDDRTQRNSLILKDVAYIVEFDFTLTEKAGVDINNRHTEEERTNDRNMDKHYSMLMERIKTGACFSQPYLGCREFSANFRLATDQDIPKDLLNKDLGLMLRDIEVVKDSKNEYYTPLYFRAQLVDSVLAVPPIKDALR